MAAIQNNLILGKAKGVPSSPLYLQMGVMRSSSPRLTHMC
jgi:hypothetical protein